MRTILVSLSLVLFLIFSIILFPVEWIVGKISPRAKDISQRRSLQGYLQIFRFLSGVKTVVIGRENIPTDTPVLYVLNHRGIFDIILSYIQCPGPTGYIAKKQFEKIPLLSWWSRWLHGYFLDRDNIREGLKVILAAIDTVKSGVSIAIFPEGTRGRGPDETVMLPFHEGSFKIASKTGCPIVPVAISHTSALFEEHVPWIHSGTVVLEYLEPIWPDQLTKEEKKFIGRYVREKMEAVLKKNAAV